jgi:hypothetical protein
MRRASMQNLFPTQAKSACVGHPPKNGWRWIQIVQKNDKSILKIKHLADGDLENKGLTKGDPENKGVAAKPAPRPRFSRCIFCAGALYFIHSIRFSENQRCSSLILLSFQRLGFGHGRASRRRSGFTMLLRKMKRTARCGFLYGSQFSVVKFVFGYTLSRVPQVRNLPAHQI